MVDYFKTLNGRLDVYFLRHGESEDNSAGIIQGRRDLPLSEEGRRQSESAAPWFVDRGIGVILTSPLRRASQTAETVGRSLGMEVRILEALNELDTGIFTGLTMEQISRRHPAAWRSFRRQSWEGVPGAESIASLLEHEALNAFIQRHEQDAQPAREPRSNHTVGLKRVNCRVEARLGATRVQRPQAADVALRMHGDRLGKVARRRTHGPQQGHGSNLAA